MLVSLRTGMCMMLVWAFSVVLVPCRMPVVVIVFADGRFSGRLFFWRGSCSYPGKGFVAQTIEKEQPSYYREEDEVVPAPALYEARVEYDCNTHEHE